LSKDLEKGLIKPEISFPDIKKIHKICMGIGFSDFEKNFNRKIPLSISKEAIKNISLYKLLWHIQFWKLNDERYELFRKLVLEYYYTEFILNYESITREYFDQLEKDDESNKLIIAKESSGEVSTLYDLYITNTNVKRGALSKAFDGAQIKSHFDSDTDISKVAYPKFLEKMQICRDFFYEYDYQRFMDGTDLERAKTISGGVNFIIAPSRQEDKDEFVKESLMLHQALSLCSSLVEESLRIEAQFFESVRVLVLRLSNQGNGKKLSLPEMNARINELLKHSIKSDGVINLFTDIHKEFSLFDPKFLEEVAKMKEKNLAVELLKKLIAEQIKIYRRTNVVKSEKFSEIIQRSMNAYLNGMLTNEQVIQELIDLAKEISDASKEGQELGLTADELAFYDALTKPQAVKDFYENAELIAITKELTDTLRKNRTIDWQKKDSARARMRMMIKKLLKQHKYTLTILRILMAKLSKLKNAAHTGCILYNTNE